MRKINIILHDDQAAALYPILTELGGNFNSAVWDSPAVKDKADWRRLYRGQETFTDTGPDQETPKKRKKFHHPSGKTQHVLMFERFAGQKNVSYNVIRTWMDDEGMNPNGISASMGKLVKVGAITRIKEEGRHATHATFVVADMEMADKVQAIASGGA